MRTEDIARICYETIRAYRLVLHEEAEPSWDKAPKSVRDANIMGVLYNLNHPGISSKQSHEEWVRAMQSTGWKYGPLKNSEKQEHPCLVPYEQLSDEQKKKDALFIAVVHALEPQSFRIPSSIEIPVIEEVH